MGHGADIDEIQAVAAASAGPAEDTGRPIVWGFPVFDVMVRADAGEFVLGGCEADPTVNAACLACGHRWLDGDGEAVEL